MENPPSGRSPRFSARGLTGNDSGYERALEKEILEILFLSMLFLKLYFDFFPRIPSIQFTIIAFRYPTSNVLLFLKNPTFREGFSALLFVDKFLAGNSTGKGDSGGFVYALF